MKFLLIPILLFSVGMAQLAPANLCLCSLLPCFINTSSHQDESICMDEESCPCQDEKAVPPCRSEKNQPSHSCPFEQTSAVSDYVGTKKLANYETDGELVFHESSTIPQILSELTGPFPNRRNSLPPVPLYLRLQSILI